MSTLLYLLHERLPFDTLLLHLRLLTHLNNQNPGHKPAIIFIHPHTSISLLTKNTQRHTFSNLMGSHGNHYSVLPGTLQCSMGKVICKVPKVKYCTLKGFQLASTQAQLTTISLDRGLPAELYWFSWRFRKAITVSTKRRTSVSPHIWTQPDALIKT